MSKRKERSYTDNGGTDDSNESPKQKSKLAEKNKKQKTFEDYMLKIIKLEYAQSKDLESSYHQLLDCVKINPANQYYCFWDWCAFNGWLKIMQWARDKQTTHKWGVQAPIIAIKRGHLDAFRWLADNGCNVNYMTIIEALYCGSLDSAQYLFEIQVKCPTYIGLGFVHPNCSEWFDTVKKDWMAGDFSSVTDVKPAKH